MPRNINTGRVNSKSKKNRRIYNLYLSIDYGDASNNDIIDDLMKLLAHQLHDKFGDAIKEINVNIASIVITCFTETEMKPIKKLITDNIVIDSQKYRHEKYLQKTKPKKTVIRQWSKPETTEDF